MRAKINLTLVLLLFCGPTSGCAWFHGFGNKNALADRGPCQLPSNASAEQIVAHLNQNANRLTSWRATSVNISARGAAMSVGAMIAVEAPRNFRLIAKPPVGGPEVDLGSNDGNFWFWNKRAEEKYVFTARHDEELGRQRRFPIPFQPDWIMEAMGVVAIDGEQIRMEPGPPRSNTIRLVSDRVSPSGQPVRKVTVVDPCHGVVREHVLYSANGQLIARAVLSGHFRDRTTQVVLPARIDLEWPQAQMALTMRLGQIEVNPPHLPAQTWAVPDYPGYEVFDLNAQ